MNKDDNSSFENEIEVVKIFVVDCACPMTVVSSLENGTAVVYSIDRIEDER